MQFSRFRAKALGLVPLGLGRLLQAAAWAHRGLAGGADTKRASPCPQPHQILTLNFDVREKTQQPGAATERIIYPHQPRTGSSSSSFTSAAMVCALLPKAWCTRTRPEGSNKNLPAEWSMV